MDRRKNIADGIAITEKFAPTTHKSEAGAKPKNNCDFTSQSNSQEFIEFMSVLTGTADNITNDITRMLLRPHGASVLEIVRETGSLSANQRISDLRIKHGIEIHSEPFLAITRKGKTTHPKRHWIREADQPWWNPEAKKPMGERWTV